MAEVAPSAGGGGGNRNFLLILGGLGAILVIGLLALGGILFLPGLFGGTAQLAGITATPTRISIPPTHTRTSQPSPTLVVVGQDTPSPDATLEPGAKLVRVTVGDNNAVTLTVLQDAKEIVVEKGTWKFDPNTREIVLTFTELNGQPFDDQVVFRIEGSEIIPVVYNKALHGDLQSIQIEYNGNVLETPFNLHPPVKGSAALGRPALQATATPGAVTGEYRGVEPPSEPGTRVMTLFLGPSSAAVMSTAEFGQTTIIQIGGWQASGDKVTVTFKLKDGTPSEEVLTLTRQGTSLVGTTTDPSLHGAQLDFRLDESAPSVDAAAPAGTYAMILPLNITPVLITATPVAITATPEVILPGGSKGGIPPAQATPAPQTGQLPQSGLGENLLLLAGGGVLLLAVIVLVRRMRAT